MSRESPACGRAVRPVARAGWSRRHSPLCATRAAAIDWTATERVASCFNEENMAARGRTVDGRHDANTDEQTGHTACASSI
jgi:endogenous inhibitor of DNA gyrase (YacG/DUF329 family)